MLDDLAIDSDVLLRFFAPELTGELLPQQARKRVGPHVYLSVSPQRVRYPVGESHVHYIGYTNNPAIRFAAHEKLMPDDGIMVLDLLPFLRELKKMIPQWRGFDKRETRDIAMEMENVFLYLFRRSCGSKPCRNEQESQPWPELRCLLPDFLPRSAATLP